MEVYQGMAVIKLEEVGNVVLVFPLICKQAFKLPLVFSALRGLYQKALIKIWLKGKALLVHFLYHLLKFY